MKGVPCSRRLDQPSQRMTRAARKKRVWREEKRFMDTDAPFG